MKHTQWNNDLSLKTEIHFNASSIRDDCLLYKIQNELYT